MKETLPNREETEHNSKANNTCMLLMDTWFFFKAKVALAENLEKCGRTQDAAEIYEEMQRYDKKRENFDNKTGI